MNKSKSPYKLSDLIPDIKNHRGEKADASFVREKYLDLPYAKSSPTQELDLFLPNTGQAPYPVIVYLHGGGFSAGDKEDWGLTPLFHALHKGYALASVNYRLSAEATFPAPVLDVKAAVRFLRGQGAQYKLNPDKIILWGESAGGYMALMTAFTANDPSLEDLNMGNPDVACKVRAVVDWFAPCELLDDGSQGGEKPPQPPAFSVLGSPLKVLLGCPPEQAPELAQKANPTHHLSAQAPPFFIQHGSEDQIVPLWQSEYLAQRLTEKIGSDNVRLSVLEGAKHGGPEFQTSENLDLILDFLETKLTD